MLIYLTGSTGFLGRIFVRQFGHKFDIVPVNHHSLLLDSYPTSQQSIFLHLGWAGVLGQYKNDSQCQLLNVNFAKEICTFLTKYQVSTFIGLGSQAEYKRTNDLIIESSLLDPETHYGEAKVKVSNLIQQYCKESSISFKWLRLFDVYGPEDNSKWLLPYIITSFLDNTSPRLSNCYQVWDYLYVDDAVDAIAAFCSHQYITDGAYNLCSGEHIRLRTIVSLVQHFTATMASPSYGDNISILPSIRGSNQKLLDLNLWKPSVDIKQGLIETIHYFKGLL